MTPRLPILLAIFGTALAVVGLMGLAKIEGGVWLGLAVLVGTGLAVAMAVRGPDVRVEEGEQ